MVGSNNDCQKELFPDLVGTNELYLLGKLNQLINDKKYYEDTLKYATNLLYSKYSINAIKTKIEKL